MLVHSLIGMCIPKQSIRKLAMVLKELACVPCEFLTMIAAVIHFLRALDEFFLGLLILAVYGTLNLTR